MPLPVKPRRWHPDLDASVAPWSHLESVSPCPPSPSVPPVAEIAIDFVDLAAVVDRIHAAFFRNPR